MIREEKRYDGEEAMMGIAGAAVTCPNRVHFMFVVGASIRGKQDTCRCQM